MKEKKDVLFLCQYFYPEYVSSAALPFDTALALSGAGFSTGALCGFPGEYHLQGRVKSRESHQGITIRRLRYLRMKRVRPLGRLINFFSFTMAVMLRFLQLR